jgi:CheY-like chemotaxis protein
MNEKVLIVDDDKLFRMMLVQILEHENWIAYEASNGFEAQEMLTQINFNLIICDLVMPDQEGLESIPIFKRDYPHIPIIAVSGGARNKSGTYLEIALTLGASKTLEKPFNRIDLINTINSLL